MTAPYRPSTLMAACRRPYADRMDVNEFETRAHALVTDATLGYDQKVRRLAARAKIAVFGRSMRAREIGQFAY